MENTGREGSREMFTTTIKDITGKLWQRETFETREAAERFASLVRDNNSDVRLVITVGEDR